MDWGGLYCVRNAKFSCVFFVSLCLIRSYCAQNFVDGRSYTSYNIYVASANKRFYRKENKGTSQQGGGVMCGESSVACLPLILALNLPASTMLTGDVFCL